MPERNIPVDVISICTAQGEIRPLRLRIEQQDHSQQRIDIDEIVSTTQISHTGAEGQIYRCRARIEQQLLVFDLKYVIRSHRWYVSGRIY